MRKALIKKLDELVSKYVRRRDRRCITCGRMAGLENGHFFSRAFHSVRWDLRNCNAQCRECNMLMETNPKMVKKYREELIKKIGENQMEELERVKNSIVKDTIQDLEDLVEKFKKDLTES